MAAKSRFRRWSLRIVIMLASLVVTVFVVEWTLTGFNLFGVRDGEAQMVFREHALVPTWTKPDGTHDLDGTLFVMQPDLDLDLLGTRLQTNSLGFRGPEIEIPKPDDVYRILVLGDSVAFGWGVDDEVTFLRRAEKRLNERDDGRRYEIVNTGILMYDSVQQRAMFERRGLAVDPDLVVTVFVVNDIEPTRETVEMLLGMRDLPEVSVAPASLLDRLANNIQGVLPSIAGLVRVAAVKTTDWDAVLPDAPKDFVPEEYGAGERGWPRAQAALRAIHAQCRERGIPFVVFDTSRPRVRALPAFCEGEGIPYREMFYTDEQLEQPILNSMFDAHANALGHQFMLEDWEAAMDSLKLPPPR